MIEVPLTNGDVFKVDDEDYQLVISHCSSWGLNANGAVRGHSKMLGKTILVHRLILNFPNLNLDIDHINRNKKDNQKSNLRLCTRSQNLQNRSKHGKRYSTSKFKGVRWHRQLWQWQARITVTGNQLFIGKFNTEVEAAQAYNDAAIKYFGAFATLNNITNP